VTESTSAVRPISSPDAKRLCTLTGVQGKIFSDKLLTLRDLESTLALAIRDADAAIKDEIFWAKALIGVKLVKLACDLTIDILSDAAGPAGKAVSMIYDRAALITDGLNGALDVKKAGQHIGETHVDALAETLNAVGKTNLGTVVGKAKTLVKTSQSAYEIYGDYSNLKSAGAGTAGAKGTLLRQLQKVQAQIAELEDALAACGLT
jgi:hypothetical protein